MLLLIVLFAVWQTRHLVLTSGIGERSLLYHGEGFDFDYPEEWRVITRFKHYGLHGPTIFVVVGTGEFDSGCVESGNGVQCSSDVQLTVTASSVVVAYHRGAWLGTRPLPSPSLGPVEHWVDVGGRAAVFSESQGSLRWAFPGSPEYIDARFGPDIATQALAQVERLIRSWRWDAAHLP